LISRYCDASATFPTSMSAVTQILLVRHGQSTWNAVGRWQGHADPPLSPLGAAQARAAAAVVGGVGMAGSVDVIGSSDLARAHQTARLMADGLGIGPVLVDERLREADLGEWTGLRTVEIEATWPGYLQAHRRPPSFEGWERVADRALAALRGLARDHPGAVALVVAHGGLIRALERTQDVHEPVVANLAGRWFDVTPTGIAGLGERVSLIDHAAVAATLSITP
jgi:broad specificity phosphatase PhoE